MRKRLFLLFALTLSSAAAAEPATKIPIAVRRLSPRVVALNLGPWDNLVLALATQKGIVVVDSGFSKTDAKACRDAIQAELKRSDFAFLINSHEHSDHLLGNSAYADVPTIGSESLRTAILKIRSDPAIKARILEVPQRDLEGARAYLLKNDPKRLETAQFVEFERYWKMVIEDYKAGLDLAPPAITFDRRMTLNLGDASVRLIAFDRFHSFADTIVSFPEENLVLTGGLFHADRLPMIDRPFSPEEAATTEIVRQWFLTLDEVLHEADGKTQFLACHGRSVMTQDQIAHQVAYLKKLWSAVCRTKAAGKTPKDTGLALAEFADLSNEANRGTIYEVPNIHERNIELLWEAAPSR